MEGTAPRQWVWDEVQAVLGGELARAGEALCCGDLRAIEARVQPLLRRVGGAWLSGLARLRLVGLADLAGEVTVRRPYYHCGGVADDRLVQRDQLLSDQRRGLPARGPEGGCVKFQSRAEGRPSRLLSSGC